MLPTIVVATSVNIFAMCFIVKSNSYCQLILTQAYMYKIWENKMNLKLNLQMVGALHLCFIGFRFREIFHERLLKMEEEGLK